MKKLFALVLALILLYSTAVAEGIDWASMTDEEIYAEIDNAKAELVKRELVGNTENVTIFDESDVTIIITSIGIDTSDWSYKPALVAEFTIINESDNDIEVYIDNVAINGWEVEYIGIADAAAGHKARDSFKFKLEDADVENEDDLETLEIAFRYENPDGTFSYIHTEPFTITF